MKTKWEERTVGEKAMVAARAVLSAAVVALALLQIFGILERAIDFAVPLLGVYLLILSLQEWKQRRGSAIMSIVVAIFIFLCTISVWFGK